jgi:hypothetical protein
MSDMDNICSNYRTGNGLPGTQSLMRADVTEVSYQGGHNSFKNTFRSKSHYILDKTTFYLIPIFCEIITFGPPSSFRDSAEISQKGHRS